MLKAAGVGGSILALIALLIVLVKALIGFVGFITLAFKILIIVAFIALIAAVGFMVFKSWNSRRTADQPPVFNTDLTQAIRDRHWLCLSITIACVTFKHSRINLTYRFVTISPPVSVFIFFYINACTRFRVSRSRLFLRDSARRNFVSVRNH